LQGFAFAFLKKAETGLPLLHIKKGIHKIIVPIQNQKTAFAIKLNQGGI